MHVKLNNRQKAILDALVAWSEPSDQKYRNEFREVLYSTDDFHYSLHQLELPGQELLEAIWAYIESLCDNSSGNAYAASEISKNPGDRFTAAWLIFHIAESSDPAEWFETSFQDQVGGLLSDEYGDDGYELQDELEVILKPVLDLDVFAKIILKLIDLAEVGPKNKNGQTFSEALDQALLLPSA